MTHSARLPAGAVRSQLGVNRDAGLEEREEPRSVGQVMVGEIVGVELGCSHPDLIRSRVVQHNLTAIGAKVDRRVLTPRQAPNPKFVLE